MTCQVFLNLWSGHHWRGKEKSKRRKTRSMLGQSASGDWQGVDFSLIVEWKLPDRLTEDSLNKSNPVPHPPPPPSVRISLQGNSDTETARVEILCPSGGEERRTWLWIVVLPLPACDTLEKSLIYLSLFPHL